MPIASLNPNGQTSGVAALQPGMLLMAETMGAGALVGAMMLML